MSGSASALASAPVDSFQSESVAALDALRSSVAALLSEIGGISKPADLQRAFDIDSTIAWQLFKLASAANPLTAGSSVPSHTGINRVLDNAAKRGASAARIEEVRTAYAGFEKLVDDHAGDRATFNSMISSLCGPDQESATIDLQQRRNIFRGFSHAMGFQIKTNLTAAIYRANPSGPGHEVISVSGLHGLRVLKPIHRLRVFGMELHSKEAEQADAARPIPLGDAGDYLLTEFSSKPAPKIVTDQGTHPGGWWYESALEWPRMGNAGATNLVFAEQSALLPKSDGGGTFKFGSLIVRPTELLLIDMLVDPEILKKRNPTGQILWAHTQRSFRSDDTPVSELEVEQLRTGSAALATPEVPHYRQLLDSLARKANWDISSFQAVRLRLNYPMVNTIAQIVWPSEN